MDGGWERGVGLFSHFVTCLVAFSRVGDGGGGGMCVCVYGVGVKCVCERE